MPVRLYIGNLPYNVTEAELREHLSAVGPLSYVSFPTDRETGQTRGFAFVEFNDRTQAEEAIRRFHNQSFKGRQLSVSEARPREPRPQTGVPARPVTARPSSTAEPTAGDPPASSDKPGRNFGPDATPQRHRSKGKSRPQSERAPKEAMREIVRGQFFGGDDDDDEDDELSDENFASRVADDDSEDEAVTEDLGAERPLNSIRPQVLNRDPETRNED